MRDLLVLGGGTAGTMAVNRLRRLLPRSQWRVRVVDSSDTHYYQPGYLYVPFGIYRPEQVARPRKRFIPAGVDLVVGQVDRVDPDAGRVVLADGTRLGYDYLIIATGTTPRPQQTPGMVGEEWGASMHEFYTHSGAAALAEKLRTWDGGRLVVHIVETPVKCPVAPLEFAFLADAFFTKRGMRDRVDITFVTPLDGAFTRPVASRRLSGLLADRNIAQEPNFLTERVDPQAKTVVSYDERQVGFDLLVTVPVNMGADCIARSGLGDELNYVPVDRETLLSKSYDNIFVIGDAGDIPTSKAGSTAHYAVGVIEANFLSYANGQQPACRFDGHTNCFVETGYGRSLLLDFNYETDPLPGKFPLPVLGPFSLLRQSRTNHWGRLAFRWVYWNVLLPGRWLPLPAKMSMAGKERQNA